MPRSQQQNSGKSKSNTSKKRTVEKRLFPKVRTGCLTCKRRRVKCGEEKPLCKRCLIGGYGCDGYDANKKEPEAAVSSLQLIRPRMSTFSTEHEYRYFYMFKDRTARAISGLSESKLWEQLTLQAGDGDETIRHAVMALGALDMAIEGGQGIKSAMALSLIEKHHTFAIRTYGKAIASMRKVLAQQGNTYRAALLFCLLTICFESMCGTWASAAQHCEAGLRLLEEFQRYYTPTNEIPRLEDTKTHGRPQSRALTSVDFGVSSPRPSVVDDDLYHTFGLLGISMRSFNPDPRGVDYYVLAKDCGSTSIENMPLEFESLKQAKAFGILMNRRIMHLFPRFISAQAISGDGEDRDLSGAPIYLATAEDQQRYNHELTSWYSAFLPLLKRARINPFSKEFAAATQLRISWILWTVVVKAARTSTQTALDKYLSDFREILLLSKILLSHPTASKKFTFEMSTIGHLYIVAIKCRDEKVRTEALSLMLSRSWRENMWDSQVTGSVANTMVAIEEEGRVNGVIPEDKRIYHVTLVYNSEQCSGAAKCYLDSEKPPTECRSITRSVDFGNDQF